MMPNTRVASIIAVRLVALVFMIVGAWMLLGNLIETLPDFNPTYTDVYLKTQVLRPILAIGIGFFIYVTSFIFAGLLTRGLERED